MSGKDAGIDGAAENANRNSRLFFHFSISAVLTLLVNGIVRPFEESVHLDLQRVDVWLRVIDKLARDSDRPDILEKKDFLARMYQWTSRIVQETASGQPPGAADLPCMYGFTGSQPPPYEIQDLAGNDIWDASWIPELDNHQADGFQDSLLMPDEAWIDWMSINDVGIDAL